VEATASARRVQDQLQASLTSSGALAVLSLFRFSDCSRERRNVQKWLPNMPSARAKLARLVLRMLQDGRSVPTQDALQLRSWAVPEDAVLSLEEIARRILIREENQNAAKQG
jgi:hypothetical protein